MKKRKFLYPLALSVAGLVLSGVTANSATTPLDKAEAPKIRAQVATESILTDAFVLERSAPGKVQTAGHRSHSSHQSHSSHSSHSSHYSSRW
jgi:hypothetical protein